MTRKWSASATSRPSSSACVSIPSHSRSARSDTLPSFRCWSASGLIERMRGIVGARHPRIVMGGPRPGRPRRRRGRPRGHRPRPGGAPPRAGLVVEIPARALDGAVEVLVGVAQGVEQPDAIPFGFRDLRRELIEEAPLGRHLELARVEGSSTRPGSRISSVFHPLHPALRVGWLAARQEPGQARWLSGNAVERAGFAGGSLSRHRMCARRGPCHRRDRCRYVVDSGAIGCGVGG